MKKVLVITYYWPPAGGPGVQRVAKFCKFLKQFGWEPIILTVRNGNYSSIDESLIKDVSEISKVYFAPSWEPHRFCRKLGGNHRNTGKVTKEKRKSAKWRHSLDVLAQLIRLNCFIPDSRIGWFPGAVREGLRVIKEEKPHVIFSSAPPYTAHLVGRKLKTLTGLPWVADFRDPWLEQHAYNIVPRWWLVKYLNANLEQNVLRMADRILCIGPNLRQLLIDKVPAESRKKFHLISNGYDKHDVRSVKKDPSYFYLSHFGPMYKSRFSVDFFKTLKELTIANNEFGDNFRFRFFGGIENEIKTILMKMFNDKILLINDYIPHERMLDSLYEPQVLLLTINDVPRNELIITGKLFEYLATGNPVLGVGPAKGDASTILADTGVGRMFDYGDTMGIKKYILSAYSYWKQGNLNTGRNSFPKYERGHLTAKLASVFEECISL